MSTGGNWNDTGGMVAVGAAGKAASAGSNGSWEAGGAQSMGGYAGDGGNYPSAGRAGNGGAMVSVCGNGILEYPEGCDDSNSVAGDGCSPTCRVESGWNCWYNLCVVVGCGNGRRECYANGQCEACDDGDISAGDGCSATCTVEAGYNCSANGTCVRAICGNRSLECASDGNGGILCESCDDGNQMAGDGCSPACMMESGWNCVDGVCFQPVCGNSTAECAMGTDGNYVCEECDDGNAAAGDGCSSTCVTEPGWQCSFDGVCLQPVCGNSTAECAMGTDGNYVCEECDDGNATNGDGCDSSCIIEPGWSCSGDSCLVLCGNLEFDCYYDSHTTQYVCETCDDGNQVTGDGCSAQCGTEVGWDCGSGECSQAVCGNGTPYECPMTANGEFVCEDCDDRNTTSGDGCSASCATEPGWICYDGTSCHPYACGDRLLDSYVDSDGNYSYEECDDGNTVNGDGCSSSCRAEAGWYCSNDVCHRVVCGDGTAQCYSDGLGGGACEACDDGNTVNGDGCSANCTAEAGWYCFPGACIHVVCGDGVVQCPGGGWLGAPLCEHCDDGNRTAGDGCSSDCQGESTLPGGTAGASGI